MKEVMGTKTCLSKFGPPKKPALPCFSITPTTRYLKRPSFIFLLIGSTSSNKRSFISAPITQTCFLNCTSNAVKNLPWSGTDADTIMCLSVVPIMVMPSKVVDLYLIFLLVLVVGFIASAFFKLSSSFCASFNPRFLRFRN